MMKFLKGLLIGLLSLILFGTVSALGFAFMLNQTFMDPNFIAGEVDKMDIAAIASSFIQIPDSGNDVNTFIPTATMNSDITSSIKNAEPGLKSELRTALFNVYDYFLGRSYSLNISISLDSFKNNLKTSLKASLLKSPPSQINGIPYSSIPKATVETTFNSYFDEIARNIPSSLSLNSSAFDVKRGISYYQFWWLTIPLILVLAVAIILLENNLRISLRNLGINLFIFGALGIAGDFLLKYFTGPSIVLPGLPAALQVWLGQFLDDVFAPLNTFSIAVAVIGVALFVSSFFIPKKEEAGA
jgi:hypothetical protein